MEASAEHYLSAAELQPGVFVILDIPWLAHGFASNSFKIRNSHHVEELRALNLKNYRYDPARSEVVVSPQSSNPPPSTGVDPVKSPAEIEADALQKARADALSAWRGKINNIEQAFIKATSVAKNINRNLLARPKETLAEMGALVDQMVSVFVNSADATLHLMAERVGGEDVYYHSLNVSILSLMLAKELGFSPEAARELGIGAMLHDIGLLEIPDKVLNKKPEEYTKSEKALRDMHVEYGVALGRKIGLSPGVLAIIGQHHEMADGTGFPRGCKGDAMTPASRVVALVDSYDTLCNPFDISKALTPHEALSYMFSKRREKYDGKVLQLMIRSLGVYPPGSIVQLSDERLAVVTSVNPKKPLRPWIMVYDPEVPKDEAVILNLESELEINVVRALRPALLLPKVAAYLNPRKRVTYFFDGEDSGKSK